MTNDSASQDDLERQDDAEDPVIVGDVPTTAQDFERDSKVGNADDDLAPPSGPSMSGGGWSSANP